MECEFIRAAVCSSSHSSLSSAAFFCSSCSLHLSVVSHRDSHNSCKQVPTYILTEVTFKNDLITGHVSYIQSLVKFCLDFFIFSQIIRNAVEVLLPATDKLLLQVWASQTVPVSVPMHSQNQILSPFCYSNSFNQQHYLDCKLNV